MTFGIERGTTLLEASAGTGKTKMLIDIVLSLLVEHKVPLKEILAITFTEPATAELGERLDLGVREALKHQERKSVEEHLLRRALIDLDDSSVFTIHGFCTRFLKEHSFACGLPLEMVVEPDSRELAQVVLAGYLTRLAKVPALARAALFAKRGKDTLMDRLKREGLRSAPSTRWVDSELPWDEIKRLEQLAVRLYELIQDAQVREELGAVAKHLKAPCRRAAEGCLRLWDFAIAHWPRVGTRFFEAVRAWDFDDEQFLKKMSKDEQRRGRGLDAFWEVLEALLGSQDRLWQAVMEDFRQWRPAFMHERRIAEGVLYFDDLLHHTAWALENVQGLSQRLGRQYQAVLVDEFQDTDPLQWQLIRRAFQTPEHRLVLIGDPKQSIYQFRGADVRVYVEAAASSNVQKTLGVNYRSHPILVEGFNHIFAGKRLSQYGEVVCQAVEAGRGREGSEEPRIRLVSLPHEGSSEDGKRLQRTKVVEDLVQDCRKEGGGFLFGQACVLVGSNREAREIQNMLSRHGVPAALSASESVWFSDESWEFRLLCQALLQPWLAPLLRRMMASRLLGEPLDALDAEQGVPQDLRECFRNAHQRWLNEGVASGVNFLWEELSMASRMLKRPQGDRAVTNLLHLLELTAKEERERSMSAWQTVRWVEEKIQQAQSEGLKGELRLEKESDAVQIMTIHKSKGLQFDRVYVPFFSRKNEKEEDEANLSEEEGLRLVYVAATRAKNYLTIYGMWPSSKAQSPLYEIVGESEQAWQALAEACSHAISFERAVQNDDSLDLSQAVEFGSQERVHLKMPDEPRYLESPAFLTSYSRLARMEAEEHAGGKDFDDLGGAPADEPEAVDPLPPGARTGSLLHAILERVDFQNSNSLEMDALIEACLREHGFAGGLVEQRIKDLISLAMHTELEPGLRLADVKERWTEAEVALPWKQEAGLVLSELLPDELREGDGAWSVAVEGLLVGFVDLIYRWNGKFYLLDWKSNFLGHDPMDYREAALAEAMKGHNYHLQYFLYTLALDVHLCSRIKDYDYATHFGGVHYVFLRGLIDGRADFGVFRARPTEDQLEPFRQHLAL
ncbi:MAG: UvrD-helicase domain-containing protein [Verrucomicrobiales bacterium]